MKKYLIVLLLVVLNFSIGGCSTKKEVIVNKTKYIGLEQKKAPVIKKVVIHFLYPNECYENKDEILKFIKTQEKLVLEKRKQYEETINFYEKQVEENNKIYEKYKE